MDLNKLQRTLYLLSRGTGDVRALRDKGPVGYGERVGKRWLRRNILGAAKRKGFWF